MPRAVRSLVLFTLLAATSAACSTQEPEDVLQFPDLGTSDAGTTDGDIVRPDAGPDASGNVVCGDGRRHFSEECDDNNMIDGDGCSATCMTESTCSRATDLSTGTPIAGGFRLTGSTTASFDGAESSDCGGDDANDRVFSYTPPADGFATFSVRNPTFYPTIYVRSACNTPSTEIACRGSSFFDDVGDVDVTVRTTAGETLYVFVDGAYFDEAGNFDLELAFTAFIAEGGTCDPASSSAACGEDLVCAPSGASFTCQAGVDLGCGTGVQVRDITSLFESDGSLSLTGSTALSPVGSFAGSCASSSSRAPQNIYKITMPYRGSLAVDLDANGWDEVVYVRSATCTGMQLACVDTPPITTLRDIAAGTELFVFVDGYTAGASGGYTLTASMTRLIEEDGSCGGSTAGRCAPGLLCVESTCQAIDLGCGLGVPVVDLDDLRVGSAIEYSGSTAGGYADSRLSCSSSTSTAPLVVHKVTMPFRGEVQVNTTKTWDDVVAIFPASCNLTTTPTGSVCRDFLPVPASALGTIEAGTELYIAVGGYSTTARGPYVLNVQFREFVAEGASCDPGRIASVCSTGLMCASTGDDAFNCTANTDLGCGLGTPVIDITDRIDETGTIRFTGSTSGLPNNNSCSVGSSSTSGELVHRIRMPYAGELAVTMPTRDFDEVVYVRTACRDSSTASQRACVDFPTLSFTTLGTFTAGQDVFIVVDGYSSTAVGTYTLEAKVRRVSTEGEECSTAEGGPRCVAPLACRDEGDTNACRPVACGDGYAEGTEQCDDGALEPGDGCNSACQLETVEGGGGASCEAPRELELIPTGPTSGTIRLTGTTAAATATVAGACGSSTGGPEHVFSFVLEQESNVTVSVTPATGYDAVAYFRGGRSGTLACGEIMGELYCRDGAGAGGAETFTVSGVAPGTYYVVVDGRGTTTANRGSYTLNITASGI
jgi:cysteine-rich repeat protein